MWALSLLLLAGSWSLNGGFFVPSANIRKARCSATYEHGMIGMNCSDANFHHVPQYIKKDIEILELSYNRIRELYNDSFVDFTYLKYLYLDDNSIAYIESGAFAPLVDLEVLDLSLNSLHQVPPALYHLKLLRKLFLGENPLGSVIFTEAMLSIEQLFLQKCRLKDLPNVEVFPRLTVLNVSYNEIKTIQVRQIAPLCRLKVLDVRRNPSLFARDGFCDCQVFKKWSSIRGIRIYPAGDEICGIFLKDKKEFDDSTCSSNETKLIFDESFLALKSCETQVLEYGTGPIRIARSVYWTLGVVVSALVLIICVASVYCAKRRRRHIREDRDRSVESLTTKSSS